MSPNRIVALATPLVAPLAGAFAAWLSQELPGVDIPADTIEEIFFVVLGVVAALALQFNHNRFKWDVEEKRVATALEATEPDSFELDDDEDLDEEDVVEIDEGELEDELEFDDIDDDVAEPVR